MQFTIQNFKFEIKPENENQIIITCQNNDTSQLFGSIVTEDQVKMKLDKFIKYFTNCINQEPNYTCRFENNNTDIIMYLSANLDDLLILKHTLVFTEKEIIRIKLEFDKKLLKLEEEFKKELSEIKQIYNEKVVYPKNLCDLVETIHEVSKDFERVNGKFDIIYYMFKAQEKDIFISKISKYLEYFQPIYKNCLDCFLDKVNKNSYKGIYSDISWKYARHSEMYRDKPEPYTIVLNSIDELHSYNTTIHKLVNGNFIISENLLKYFSSYLITNVETIHNWNNEVKIINGNYLFPFKVVNNLCFEGTLFEILDEFDEVSQLKYLYKCIVLFYKKHKDYNRDIKDIVDV